MSGHSSLDPDGLDGLLAPGETDARSVSASDVEGEGRGAERAVPPAPGQRKAVWRGVVVACAIVGLFLGYRSFRQDATLPADAPAASAVPPTSTGASVQAGAGDSPQDFAVASPAPVSGNPPAEASPAKVAEGQPVPAEPVPQAARANPEMPRSSEAAAPPSPKTEPAPAVSPVLGDAETKDDFFTQRFRFNSLSLRDLTAAERGTLVAYARSCRGGIRIVGHTCNVGPDGINRRIGLARARAVRDLLRSEGLADRTIRIESAGASQPIATNDSETGRANNRRVEVYCPAGAVSTVQQGSPEGEARR